MIFLDDGAAFPEGTVFTLNGENYYPSGGRVYIPLTGTGNHLISMDTTDTAGLTAGERTFFLQIFPTGASAGNATASVSYTHLDVYKRQAQHRAARHHPHFDRRRIYSNCPGIRTL